MCHKYIFISLMTFLCLKYLECIRIRIQIHLKSNVFVFELLFLNGVFVFVFVFMTYNVFLFVFDYICMYSTPCLSIRSDQMRNLHLIF